MSDGYKDNEKDKNYDLCQKYPFLMPKNRWTGNVADDFDYSYTELDAMPDGWRFAFGEKMCEEIKQALTEDDCLDSFCIMQIKEKYGSLRFYTNFCTDKLSKIIDKYEKISKQTCIKCGEPATQRSIGWISPWCDECAKTIQDTCMPIHSNDS